MLKGSCPRRYVRALGFGVVLALGLVIAAARAGDPATAKSLLGSAKDALEQKKYDTALSLLAKARAEDPELLEVGYWLGLTQDKKGDSQAALREYRAFRESASLLQQRWALTKELAELLKKAQVRVTALAPGEVEDAKLRALLATELLSIAKSREAKDKAAAALALEALLVASPDHAEARQALARVTQPPMRKGEFALPEVLQSVGPWNDMIAKTPFGFIKEWQYVDPGLVIEGKGTYGAAEAVFINGNCVLDMEMRLVAIHEPEWRVGWGLITKPDTLFCLFMEGVSLALTGVEGSSSQKIADRREIPGLKVGTWHRLTVLVQEKKVQTWVDGGKPSTFTVDSLGPNTQMYMVHGGCKLELRTFRWTRLP
jgi:hypothetical protein